MKIMREILKGLSDEIFQAFSGPGLIGLFADLRIYHLCPSLTVKKLRPDLCHAFHPGRWLDKSVVISLQNKNKIADSCTKLSSEN
jgi:hypothetical protein